MRVTVRNRGPETATLHVLPTLWFRNEWSWNPEPAKPELPRGPGRPVDPGEPPRARRLHARDRPRPGRDAADPALLRERDEPRADRGRPVDHAVSEGRHQRPRHRRCRDGQPGRRRDEGRRLVPAGRAGRGDRRAPAAPAQDAQGRQAARRERRGADARSATAEATAEGGNGKAAAEDVAPIDPLGPSFESTMRRREAEADDFYAALRREGGTDDEQRIMRQAFAGMLWSKQYYGYNVARWLDGDPGLPPPPAGAPDRPQRRLAALRRGRHPVDARPVGVPVVRGLGPRRSTRSPSPTSTRPSRSTSSCCCAASGSSTRTARCPPTSGRSTTSTRRSTRRPPTSSGRSTGAGTTSSCGGSSTSCCSTSPGGSTARTRRATTSSRAGSSASTTSARSTGRTCRPGPSSSSPTRRPGCSMYCLNMLRIATVLAENDPPTRTSRRRSWSTPSGSPRR